MKTKNIFFVFLLLLSYDAFAQKIIINGEETNRKLTWADFKGKPDKTSSFLAYTYYNVSYKFGTAKATGDSVKLGDLEVVVELDPKKTWAKSDKLSDDLLAHEQGHFNIGIMCMREMYQLFKDAKLTRSNFNILIQNISQDTRKKYRDMGLKYDEETEHSKNKEQQAKWNAFFAEKGF